MIVIIGWCDQTYDYLLANRPHPSSQQHRLLRWRRLDTSVQGATSTRTGTPLPAVAAAVWQVVGITDERDTCDNCGKTGLKRVVAMRAGADGETFYFGTWCAATLTGRPAERIRSEARQAALAAQAAAEAKRRLARDAEDIAAAIEAGFTGDLDGRNTFHMARATVRYRRHNSAMVRSARTDVAWHVPGQLAAFDAYLTAHGIDLPDVLAR